MSVRGYLRTMMYVIFQSFLLLFAAILAHAIITEEPVTYEFCQCPCQKAIPLEVDVYFPTKASCTYLRNHYTNGYMFVADEVFDGKRQVYHDLTHKRTKGDKRRPSTAFWKVYYPWKNYTGDPQDSPQVIQNILNLEFIIWTDVAVPQSNHEVVTIPTLTAHGLWNWYVGDKEPTYGYRIGNHFSKEFLEADERLTGGRWNEGRVFTDIMKRNRSSLFLDKYAWYVEGCWF